MTVSNKLQLAGKPLFFKHARTWRNYTGGKFIDELMGEESGVDCEFPEAWIASTTKADNGAGHPENEGLAEVILPDGNSMLFRDLFPEYAEDILGEDCKEYSGLPVLCKFLDSAMRLSLQVHPDKEFAKDFFHSEYGKTECWIILDSRPIDGEEPYLLLGFKEGVKKDMVQEAILQEDFARLESYFHKVPVKAGDVWFLPGGLPHAIGPGVFLLEVQEPTDLIIQPELSCGNVKFTPEDRWGGLDMLTALDCFHYEENTLDSLHDKYYLKRKLIKKQNGSLLSSIVGEGYDECFHVDLLQVAYEYKLKPSSWVLAIIVKGCGKVTVDSIDYDIKQGDAVLLPVGKDNVIKTLANNRDLMELYLVSE